MSIEESMAKPMRKSWMPRRKLVICPLFLGAFVAGTIDLSSQDVKTREYKPARRGTLRWYSENPNITDEIRLGLHVEYPIYQNLETLASVSDVIVRGRVVAWRSIPCDRDEFICTQFRLRVDQIVSGKIPNDRRGEDRIPTFKDRRTGKPATGATPKEDRIQVFEGPGPDEIVIAQAGGTLWMEGRRIDARVVDEERLQVHREYVLFLKWVPENRSGNYGKETYHLMAGSQAGILIEDDTARSMVKDPFETHPIKFEVERLFQGHSKLLISHLEKMQTGVQP